MPRIRSIKPELWQDESVGELSRDARLLFVGLITQADDEGRLVGAARLLWSQIFPWDDYDPASLAQWLGELTTQGMVSAYEAGGREYLVLPHWKSHQKISHPTKSKLPKPPKGPRKPPDPSRRLRSVPEDSGEAPAASPLIGSEGIGEDRTTPLRSPRRGDMVGVQR